MRRSIYWKVIIGLWIFIALFLGAVFLLSSLADWYIDSITPLWAGTYGRINGLVSFSVGEIMLTAGAVLVAALIILVVIRIFCRGRRFKGFFRGYARTCLALFSTVCLIMAMNCVTLYQGSTLDPNPSADGREYSVKELEILRNYIIEKCNSLSYGFQRDSEGYLETGYLEGIQEKVKAALNGISELYPRLSGYYPDAKPMLYSRLMSQMYMSGYFFPFSMEANYNDMMYTVNYPAVLAHEMAHLHGIIYEDEANFIGFLACVRSGDEFLEYSGYMSVLNYVYNAYWDNVVDWQYYASLPQTNDLVDTDNIFLTEESWANVEEGAVLDTETVNEVSSALTDATLKVNGIKDGMASYSRVVGLLLQYYDGILY